MRNRRKGRNSKPPRSSHTEARGRDRQAGFSREVRVIYEDDSVVVLDKPPGLLAVPIKGSDTPSALSILSASLRPAIATGRRQRAFVVHRIDRFASGILLFARTEQDRDALIRQFLAHTPVRQYLAVVRGRVSPEAGTLVHYFRRQGFHQQLSSASGRDAARAELHYSVERALKGASLVRVELVTGLQNQIRAQFAAIGNPLIGDRKYRPEETQEKLIDRVALHAAHLEFIHPRSGEPVVIDCEPPGDFEKLVKALSRTNV